MPRLIDEYDKPQTVNFKVPRVARRLGVSDQSVWRRVQDGTIRTIKYGRSVRIPVEELERLEREGF